MPTGQRFKDYIDFKRISVNKAASRLEVTPASLYTFINGKVSSKVNLLEKMGKAFPDLNMNWLIRGIGNMIVIDAILPDQLNEDDTAYNAKVYDNLDFYPALKMKVQELDRIIKGLQANKSGEES